jgi:basic amino acid/polyamine antiporter, APA family
MCAASTGPAGTDQPDRSPQLQRKLTLLPATALNMIDMVGVGPFATLPLMVKAMGGSLALVGWIAGAIIAIADGLIWAELGAALPKAGGTYEYVKEIYGREKLGKLLAFLFTFQLIFTAPVSIATGCVGLAGYASYIFPSLQHVFFSSSLGLHFLGDVTLKLEVSGATLAAIAAALLATVLVARGIDGIARISKYLWIGVLATLVFVIFTGLTHFHAGLAFPQGWLHQAPPNGFLIGFSGALLVALYDYWGYYNICFLAEEVVDPPRTIPRSMVLSIVIVGALYLLMNIGILGQLPVAEMIRMTDATAGNYPAARAAQMAWGNWGGNLVALAVVWTAFASVFALLTGYSRIPFAAARDHNFFSAFQRLHKTKGFPVVSVVFMGMLAAVLCVFQLGSLISALVIVRILMVFLVQALGVVYWRMTKPAAERPFRMWLYPLPVVITLVGFALVFTDPDRQKLVARGLTLGLAGVIIFLVRAFLRKQWPFAAKQTAGAAE